MNRLEIKKWLQLWLEERPWNQGSSTILKCSHKNIYDLVIGLTDYLKKETKLSERVYHILNDFSNQPICNFCQIRCLAYKNLFDGYKNCCGRCQNKYLESIIDETSGLNRLEIKIKKRLDTMSTNVDENGENTFQRMGKEISRTKLIVDSRTGLTNAQESNIKALKTKRNTIDPATKMNILQIAGKKNSITKTTTKGEDGLTIAERSAKKTAMVLKNKIDKETGFTIGRMSALKAIETKRNTIDENGVSLLKRSLAKTTETKRNTIDSITGLNLSQRGGLKAIETRIKNGTLSNGFSLEGLNIIKKIIDYYNLNNILKFELFYADGKNKKEWWERNIRKDISIVFYDFVIRQKETKEIIFVMEYHGSAFHINKEENELLIEKGRDKKNHFGNSLRESYEKDQIKKQHMIEKYGCKYLEVFDYEWKVNKQDILDKIGKFI